MSVSDHPQQLMSIHNIIIYHSPRFLCRPMAFFFARAVGRQRALHKENSRFAAPTPGQHISTFCGYRILFSIRNPYINRFTNHFSFIVNSCHSKCWLTVPGLICDTSPVKLHLRPSNPQLTPPTLQIQYCYSLSIVVCDPINHVEGREIIMF